MRWPIEHRTYMLSIAMPEGSKSFRSKGVRVLQGLDLIWHAYAQTGWFAIELLKRSLGGGSSVVCTRFTVRLIACAQAYKAPW